MLSFLSENLLELSWCRSGARSSGIACLDYPYHRLSQEKLRAVGSEMKDRKLLLSGYPIYAYISVRYYVSPDIAGPYVMYKRHRARQRRNAFPSACSLAEGRQRRRCSAWSRCTFGRGSPISEPCIYRHSQPRPIRNFNSRGHSARDLTSRATLFPLTPWGQFKKVFETKRSIVARRVGRI